MVVKASSPPAFWYRVQDRNNLAEDDFLILTTSLSYPDLPTGNVCPFLRRLASSTLCLYLLFVIDLPLYPYPGYGSPLLYVTAFVIPALQAIFRSPREAFRARGIRGCQPNQVSPPFPVLPE